MQEGKKENAVKSCGNAPHYYSLFRREGAKCVTYITRKKGMAKIGGFLWTSGVRDRLPQEVGERGFDETARIGENQFVVVPQEWACGAVGSALPWHGRGHRFDPDQVHQLNQSLRANLPSQLGSILAANFQRPAKTVSLPPLS